MTELKDNNGNPTAHLSGILSKTIHFLEAGVKPIWVFDGKPPEEKKEELEKWAENKRKAEEERKDAEAVGDFEKMAKMAVWTVKVTKQMTEDAKKLLILMGVPVVEAPCEAEAQCSAIVKAGLAYGTVSEDMDSLA